VNGESGSATGFLADSLSKDFGLGAGIGGGIMAFSASASATVS